LAQAMRRTKPTGAGFTQDVGPEVPNGQLVEVGPGRVRVRVLLDPAAKELVQLGSGLVQAHAGSQPGHQVEEVVPPAVLVVVGVYVQGAPDVDLGVLDVEAGRQNAHDRLGPAVDADGLAHELGIGAEGSAPEAVREHHDRLGPGQVLVVRVDAARRGLDAQGPEEGRGAHRGGHPQGLVVGLDAGGARAVATQV